MTRIIFLLLAGILYSQNVWQNTGFQGGGREVNSFTVNKQNHLFLAAGERVYKSTNNGNSFGEYIFQSSTGGCFSIASDLKNNIIYVGLGLVSGSGGGIYKTTNNGNFWTFAGLANEAIFDIVVDSNGIVLATSYSEYPKGWVFRSSNFGISWNKTYSWQSVCLALYSLNNFYIGTEDPSSGGEPILLVSTDTGLIWNLFKKFDGYTTYLRGIGINKLGDIVIYFLVEFLPLLTEVALGCNHYRIFMDIT